MPRLGPRWWRRILRWPGSRGSQNLVVSTGEFGGDTVFSGHGAGGNPTAVAVVSDLLRAATALVEVEGWRPPTMLPCEGWPIPKLPRYIRFMVRDRPGIFAALAGYFPTHDINIDAVLQRPGYAEGKVAVRDDIGTLQETTWLQEALGRHRRIDFSSTLR